MSRILATAILFGVFASFARATPIEVPVDPSSSTVTVELCLGPLCDSDTSPVVGFSSIKLSPFTAPGSIALYDFDYLLTQPIDIFITLGILGHFTATGTDIELIYPTPGTPQPPVAVSGNAFTYPNVPTDSAGLVAYTATGVFCSQLQGLNPPLPCVDTMDLSQQGTYAGTITGTVTVSPARLVTLSLNVNVSQPIDASNPSAGTITMTGPIVGSVTVPIRGDANQDGVLDGRDIAAAVAVLLNPGAATWQQRFAVDMNDDDAFDAADASALAECLLGSGCPQ